MPGFLEVRHDQLKELVSADKIAAYEVMGRDVILYWRSLKAEQRIEFWDYAGRSAGTAPRNGSRSPVPGLAIGDAARARWSRL